MNQVGRLGFESTTKLQKVESRCILERQKLSRTKQPTISNAECNMALKSWNEAGERATSVPGLVETMEYNQELDEKEGTSEASAGVKGSDLDKRREEGKQFCQ